MVTDHQLQHAFLPETHAYTWKLYGACVHASLLIQKAQSARKLVDCKLVDESAKRSAQDSANDLFAIYIVYHLFIQHFHPKDSV